MPGKLKLKGKVSKGAQFAKIKWDTAKHKRDQNTGRFVHKPGSEEFKAETYGPGKTSNVKSTDIIKLHVTSNPKKPGSNSADRFAHYKDGMTVGEFKSLGGKPSDLSNDTSKGFITIHDPAALPKGPPLAEPEPPPPPKLSVAEYAITGKTANFAPHDKIKILIGHNPKKPGSMAADAFAKYKDEMTVAEFYAAEGGKKNAQSHLLWDTKKGFISIHNPNDLADMQSGKLGPGVLAAHMKGNDGKLGVVTKNPFTPGTKNHDDFEVTAKQEGLTTEAAVTAKLDPATGEAKPKLDDLGDDDYVVSQYGSEYKVSSMKGEDAQFKQDVDNHLASGKWTVKPKNAGVKDTDVIQPVNPNTGAVGGKYTVAEYKTLTGMDNKGIDGLVAGGKFKVNPDGPGVISMKDGGPVLPKPGVQKPQPGAQAQPPAPPVKPPPPAPAPDPVVTKPAGPLPKQMVDDDDILETGSGLTLTAAKFKEDWTGNGFSEEAAIHKLNNSLAAGHVTLKTKPKGWFDDDVVETYMGNKHTVGEYKTKYLSGMNDDEANKFIDAAIKQGDLKAVAKIPPPPAPPPKHNFTDEDQLVTPHGWAGTVKEFKDLTGLGDGGVQQKLAAGHATLKAKPVSDAKAFKPTVDTLDDDDVIITSAHGIGLSGKEIKESSAGNPHLKAEYDKALASGDWQLQAQVHKTKAVTTLAGVPKAEYKDWEVATITANNPYPPNSEAWVKFKKIHNTSSGMKSMTVEKYLSSTTNVANQEKILDQMVADGHVKFVTPEHKKAIAEQKAKFAADQAVKDKAAKQNTYKTHYELQKPADHHDDPKWGSAGSKVAGIHDLSAPGKTEKMEATRVAVSLKFNSNSHPAVSSYTGSGYSSINYTLRKGGGFDHLTLTEKKHVKALDALMGTTKDDAIMWRGISGSGKLNDIPPPLEFPDLGFASMSHNPNQSLNTFAGTSAITGNKVLFKVRVPKGTKGAFISRRYSEAEAMKDEAEVIAARGTRFKYISTTENVTIGGYTKIDVIEVEIVQDNGANI
jgi:hypothetical protein